MNCSLYSDAAYNNMYDELYIMTRLLQRGLQQRAGAAEEFCVARAYKHRAGKIFKLYRQ